MKIKLFFNECVIILLYLTAIVRKIEVGIKKVMVISCCMFLFIGNTFAKITLPSLVGNNMVLQQSTNVKMWGKSTASQVTISPSWTKKKYIAKTDKEGKWIATVKTPSAGGPYTITFNDGQTLKISNVLIGEVWICSGQSNMEIPISGYPSQPIAQSLDAIVHASKYDKIRLFTVERNSKNTPQNECTSQGWLCSSPETVSKFSATAYFFGRALTQQLNIPIGLVLSCWGGTAIEAWMDAESIAQLEGKIDMEVVKKRRPSSLYNGMINPIINYTAKGFVWYQGEANTRTPQDYDKLMISMVKSWRNKWNNEKMPFYYVQLAPYKYTDPQDIKLPLTIEAQYKAHAAIPYSGIAATTDIGHKECVHPEDKETVGNRLAFMALRNDYGINGLPNDAPTFKSMEIADGKAYIKFNNTEGAGNSIAYFDLNSSIKFTGFEIAGADKVFYPASASYEGGKQQMKVWSDKVPAPVAVRYDFHNYMLCNVHTNFGQPLVPFRTDDW